MRKISQRSELVNVSARRPVVAMGLFWAAALFAARPAEAQQFDYNNFTSSAGIQLNGSAAVVTNNEEQQVLRITPAENDQVGTAWYTTQVSLLKGFSTTFRFQIGGSTAPGPFNADGFAFVIQNGSFCNGTSGTTADEGLFPDACPSGEGGSLGYLSLTNSVAIEFDTFQNVGYGDVSGDEVGIQSCGAGANTVDHTVAACNFGQTDLSTPKIILTDGNVHTATISYAVGANLLVVIVDGVQVLSTPFDMSTLGLDANQDAYVGFTGATGGFGGGNDNQDILSWTFDTVQTQSLGAPGTTTTFTFNTDTYKITGVTNQGGEQVTVDAFAIPASLFPTLFGFAAETCVPYGDYSTGGVDTCVEFEVHCQVSAADATPCNFDYLVATGYDLPTDLSGGIGGPDFLVAHGVDCPLTSSSDVQSIFLSYEATIKDPTTKGGSRGPSCFVATYTPGAPPITTGTVSVNSYFVGFQPPIQNPPTVNDINAGATIPAIWQLFDANNNPITPTNLGLTYCVPTAGSPCAANTVAIKFVPISCGTLAADTSTTDPTISSAGASGLQFNPAPANSWQFNIKTPKSFKNTCQLLEVSFPTGVSPSTPGPATPVETALFRFH